MNKQMNKIYERSFVSGGEIYSPIEEMQKYISSCNDLGVVIIAVDFFKVKEGLIQPAEMLSGFDASILFDEKLEKMENVKNCNLFILDCYEKSKNRLKGCYFVSVTEYD